MSLLLLCQILTHSVGSRSKAGIWFVSVHFNHFCWADGIFITLHKVKFYNTDTYEIKCFFVYQLINLLNSPFALGAGHSLSSLNDGKENSFFP